MLFRSPLVIALAYNLVAGQSGPIWLLMKDSMFPAQPQLLELTGSRLPNENENQAWFNFFLVKQAVPFARAKTAGEL